MKRYDIHATLSYDSQGPYAQWEEWEEEDGKWCLASEAQAEIDRLRGVLDLFANEAIDFADELGHTHTVRLLRERLAKEQ